MSLIARCTVCDASLSGYNGNTRCERCNQDCPSCGGDVAFCKHPLPVEPVPYTRMSIELRPDGGKIAA